MWILIGTPAWGRGAGGFGTGGSSRGSGGGCLEGTAGRRPEPWDAGPRSEARGATGEQGATGGDKRESKRTGDAGGGRGRRSDDSEDRAAATGKRCVTERVEEDGEGGGGL